MGWSSSNDLTGVKLKFLVSNVHPPLHLSRIPKYLVYNVYVQSKSHLLCLFLLTTDCGTGSVSNSEVTVALSPYLVLEITCTTRNVFNKVQIKQG
jgi:hypothetical protein